MKAEDTADHKMHAEYAVLSAETAAALNAARAQRRAHRRGRHDRAADCSKARRPMTARSSRSPARPSIFITPGYRFRAVDVLLTNFHLPRSTLFMLVSAFCGLDAMQRAYAHAIAAGYRFYSYGDACSVVSDDASRSPSTCIATDGAARRGEISTPRGDDRDAGLHAGRHAGDREGCHLR